MPYPIYQVDAFTEKVFSGNPAAIVPLQKWLPEKLMQHIAMENNLSETAFFVPVNGAFHIRWFTPVTEVSLCGHATLATAHVIYNHTGYKKHPILFQSKTGLLKVYKEGNLLELDFPSSNLTETQVPENIRGALDKIPDKCLRGKEDLMFIFSNEEEIRELKPDFEKLKSIEVPGIIVTAPSEKYDFVSRYFAPREGINEDPVTGSAHTMLIPYWAKRLKKNNLKAKQISPRGGVLYGRYLQERVKIGGYAVTYLEGEISV
jgi:PhzF family phenazine biosynthesis protein